MLTTPEAALETSDRLLAGARQAKGRQIQAAQRREARGHIEVSDNDAPPPATQTTKDQSHSD